MNTLIGTKIKMSQAFVDGKRTPVTQIKLGPCVVTQIKKEDKDGYWAVQLGFGTKRPKNISKPLTGHLKKSKSTPRFINEIRVTEEPKLKVGDTVKISDVFSVGDAVTAIGVSKGKGFAGAIKRWGFAAGPRTHGQSDRRRAPGSIGQGTTPGRVHKGKKMPGRMGTTQATVRNLKVVSIDEAKNILEVSGPIPGPNKAKVIVKNEKN